MNEVEKKALERYPHDYPERSGYIEGYKAALESVKAKVDEMLAKLNEYYNNGSYPFTPLFSKMNEDQLVLQLVDRFIERQMREE